MKIAVFKVNQLGDNVIFLPVIQTLRRLYPAWELALFTSPTAAQLYTGLIPPDRLRVERTADFNGAWKRPALLWSLWGWLRAFGPDASQLGDDQGNVAHILAATAGGSVRAGGDLIPLRVPSALTHSIKLPRHVRIGALNWEIARALVTACGGLQWPEHAPPPDLSHLANGARRQARRIVIHPGASRAYKRWPAERFRELATRLSSNFDVVWIETLETPTEQVPGSRMSRPKDLRELTEEIAGASLFIGNNSGPMHLCSALGCPSVILNGPSHSLWDPIWQPERFLLLKDLSLPCQPCDDNVRPAEICRNKLAPMTCLDRWSVEAVEKLCRHWHARWSNRAGTL